jgi:hypothetical protein
MRNIRDKQEKSGKSRKIGKHARKWWEIGIKISDIDEIKNVMNG